MGSRHLSMEELEAGIEEIRRSPKDEGVLQLIVRRPATLKREMIQEGQHDPPAGDGAWSCRRPSSAEPSAGSPCSWQCCARAGPRQRKESKTKIGRRARAQLKLMAHSLKYPASGWRKLPYY